MTLRQLSKARTYEDVTEVISTLRDSSFKVNNWDMVSDTDIENLSYMLSTFKEEIILSHYFTVIDTDRQFIGLYALRNRDDGLIKISDIKYRQYYVYHDKAWMFLLSDMTYSFYAYDKEVLTGILRVRQFTLNDVMKIVAMFTKDNCYLVCVNAFDARDGVYSPKNEDDFMRWYSRNLYELGVEGVMDNTPLSTIISAEIAIRHDAFNLGFYKQLDIK